MTDITRLLTFSSYAKMKGCKRQWIYFLAKDGKLGLPIVEIDGVKFVQLT